MTAYAQAFQRLDCRRYRTAHRMLGHVRAGMDEATRSTDGARERLEAMATWMFAESRRAARVLRDANRFVVRGIGGGEA